MQVEKDRLSNVGHIDIWLDKKQKEMDAWIDECLAGWRDRQR